MKNKKLQEAYDEASKGTAEPDYMMMNIEDFKKFLEKTGRSFAAAQKNKNIIFHPDGVVEIFRNAREG